MKKVMLLFAIFFTCYFVNSYASANKLAESNFKSAKYTSIQDNNIESEGVVERKLDGSDYQIDNQKTNKQLTPSETNKSVLIFFIFILLVVILIVTFFIDNKRNDKKNKP